MNKVRFCITYALTPLAYAHKPEPNRFSDIGFVTATSKVSGSLNSYAQYSQFPKFPECHRLSNSILGSISNMFCFCCGFQLFLFVSLLLFSLSFVVSIYYITGRRRTLWCRRYELILVTSSTFGGSPSAATRACGGACRCRARGNSPFVDVRSSGCQLRRWPRDGRTQHVSRGWGRRRAQPSRGDDYTADARHERAQLGGTSFGGQRTGRPTL